MSNTQPTLTEIRDTLAEWDGWEKFHASNGIDAWQRGKVSSPLYQCVTVHPFPATLDAAAGAMPEGWDREITSEYTSSGVIGSLGRAFNNKGQSIDTGVLGPFKSRLEAEIEAAYGLAYACRLAEREPSSNA